MSKNALHLDAARKQFESLLLDPAKLPVSFTYDGKPRRSFAGAEFTGSTVSATPAGRKATLRFRLDDVLEARVEAAFCAEFGEMEYTVWFENTGDRPSKTLEDVRALDIDFPGGDPVLRGCLGDHENFYAAYEHDLLKADRHFLSTNGRATHIVFPYFDLVHGDGGTLVALGWAGTWEALFAAHDDVVSLWAKTCLGLEAALLPGETIRTGLVVMLPYKGRNADDATNLWREWFLKYNLPKADAGGTPLQPFSTVGFASDTGLPNSDGSISERWFTWKPTLDRLAAEGMVADFRWFDAGWYVDPAGNTVESDWWGTVGAWELDREKWPGTSFRDSNEACHALGMKVFAWFEPERVTHVEDLAANFGYNPGWGVDSGWCVTSNLGDPDCLAWTLGRIVKMMDENAVDMYREDNNSDPAGSWSRLDDRDEAAHPGLKRRGVNENKCIQGHYALWDGIIAYCAANGKCPYVDSCASGGGRNDIESMRRGFPMMRSDYDRTSSSMRLSQTSTFCKWIPFHGSATKETATQLEASTGAGSDAYTARASFLPIYNFGEAFTHNPDLDFDLMRRNFAEWKSVRHLLTRDFYVLTPWHHNLSRKSWTVFAYDAPDLGESLVLAFRMEEAQADAFTARLPFADPAATYEVADADTGAIRTLPGSALREGIPIRLGRPRASALLRLRVLR
ncbi:MAG: alpha-galactosidase [Kiritimatiellia bacterium]|jgi:alpha-galactosidase